MVQGGFFLTDWGDSLSRSRSRKSRASATYCRPRRKSFALYRLSAMMPIKGLQDNRFARRGNSPVNHVRTRLIAKLALVLLSFGTLLPGSLLEAREVDGSPSSAKTVKAVKTAVKKSHTTVTRRYSSRASRARRARCRARTRLRPRPPMARGHGTPLQSERARTRPFPTSAPKPPSSTTRSRSRCSGKRTRRTRARSPALPR